MLNIVCELSYLDITIDNVSYFQGRKRVDTFTDENIEPREVERLTQAHTIEA